MYSQKFPLLTKLIIILVLHVISLPARCRKNVVNVDTEHCQSKYISPIANYCDSLKLFRKGDLYYVG